MFIKIIVPVVSMLCITAIELFAIHRGLNGTMLSVSIAAVAGIGGYQIHKIKSIRGNP
jgi:hypothetical protein